MDSIETLLTTPQLHWVGDVSRMGSIPCQKQYFIFNRGASRKFYKNQLRRHFALTGIEEVAGKEWPLTETVGELSQKPRDSHLRPTGKPLKKTGIKA